MGPSRPHGVPRLPKTIWDHIGAHAYGAIWDHMDHMGAIWDHMEPNGSI